jgi:hypothetical protein
MISRKGWDIGQRVKFQDSNFVWREGEVVEVIPADHKLIGPGSTLTEVKAAKLRVAYRDSITRKWKESEMPVKRVKAVAV